MGTPPPPHGGCRSFASSGLCGVNLLWRPVWPRSPSSSAGRSPRCSGFFSQEVLQPSRHLRLSFLSPSQHCSHFFSAFGEGLKDLGLLLLLPENLTAPIRSRLRDRSGLGGRHLLPDICGSWWASSVRAPGETPLHFLMGIEIYRACSSWTKLRWLLSVTWQAAGPFWLPLLGSKSALSSSWQHCHSPPPTACLLYLLLCKSCKRSWRQEEQQIPWQAVWEASFWHAPSCQPTMASSASK